MDKIQKIIENILKKHNVDLVDFNLRNNKNRRFLKLLVDLPEGNIKLDQVSKITREINNNEEFIANTPDNFRLEVSSPGLSFPMKTGKDFKRRLNEIVRVKFDSEKGVQSLSGKLIKVDDNTITLSIKSGEKEITLETVIDGKVELKF